MYCLETSFLVDLLKGEKEAVELCRKICNSKLYTTSISAWEILRGPKIAGKEREYGAALRLLDSLDILPFTLSSAKISVEIENELRRRGEEINLIDLLVASIAIEKGLKLVTRDKHFSRIDGLDVVRY